MAEQKNKGLIGTAIVIAVALIACFLYSYFFAPKHYEYVVYYDNVKGLQTSSPVTIRGARVGKIKSISLENNGTLKVEIILLKGIQVHDSAKAILASAGLISDKSIQIIDTFSNHLLPYGSTLISDLDTTTPATSIKTTPYLVTAKYVLHTADSFLQDIRTLTTTGIVSQFIIPLTSFEKRFTGYAATSGEWNKTGDSLAKTINTLENSTRNLASKSRNWHKELSNADSQISRINNSSLAQSITSINKNMKSISRAVKNANNANTGTGKYIHDKSAYTSANKDIDSLNENLGNLQKAPPGFRIFGKNKKKK